MLLDERKLNEYVKELSMEYFDKPYNGKVNYNARLKRAAGQCYIDSGRIELSTTYFKHATNEQSKDVILHELVHYHLDRAGYINEHHGAKFKALAKKVGTALHGEAVPIKYYNHIEATCENCGYVYYQFKAFDENKYVCGKCKGKLHCKRVKAVE